MSDASSNMPSESTGLNLKAILKEPVVLALFAIIILLGIGEAVSPGFARGDQIIKLLTVAALLGFAAAGQNLVVLSGGEGD